MSDTDAPFAPAPSELHTDAEPFSLDLGSGAVACGLVVVPAVPPSAVLVLSPALGVHAAFYVRLARALSDAGIAVVLHEQRGHGASPVRADRTHDWGYRELVEEELPAIVAHARTRFPGLPLFMGGHSLGAQLACLAAGTMAERPAGLVILASGVQHARLYRPLWRFGALTGAFLFPRAARWRGFHDGPRMYFGGREPIRLMQDWARVVHTGRYQPEGTLLDYEAALASLELPILMLTLERDDYAPRKSALGLAAKMPRAGLTHLHWGSTELAGAPADHFGWTRRPEPVARAVAGWIKLRAGL